MSPKATTLYRAYDARGQLLYVGISSSPFLRFGQHDARAGWTPYAATITLERFTSRLDAEAAELVAIRTDDPVWNIQGRPAERFLRWMAAYPERGPDEVDIGAVTASLNAYCDRIEAGSSSGAGKGGGPIV